MICTNTKVLRWPTPATWTAWSSEGGPLPRKVSLKAVFLEISFESASQLLQLLRQPGLALRKQALAVVQFSGAVLGSLGTSAVWFSSRGLRVVVLLSGGVAAHAASGARLCDGARVLWIVAAVWPPS